MLAPCPPPTYHSFSSIQLRNTSFTVSGDALVIAQARAFLEAVFANLTTPAAHAVEVDLTRLEGRYHRVHSAGGQIAEIYSRGLRAPAGQCCASTQPERIRGSFTA